MAGQVLPAAQGNIRQKMADLKLETHSEVSFQGNIRTVGGTYLSFNPVTECSLKGTVSRDFMNYFRVVDAKFVRYGRYSLFDL